MQIYRSINIDIPEGLLEDVTACFDIEIETYPAEPYSWGGSRGMDYDVTSELTEVHLGGLVLDRDQMVKMLCDSEVAELEAQAADWALEHKDEL